MHILIVKLTKLAKYSLNIGLWFSQALWTRWLHCSYCRVQSSDCD